MGSRGSHGATPTPGRFGAPRSGTAELGGDGAAGQRHEGDVGSTVHVRHWWVEPMGRMSGKESFNG
jgi:hypothetical protein